MTGKQKGKAANITNDNGPLTLDEARALVQAKQPKAARRPLAKAATPQPPASPARVAVERSKLKQERREELARRVREYKATMTILKRRGARPPSAPPKKGAKAPVAKAGGFTPLQILAEGDSWFDYPYPLFGGGIIPRLETRTGVPILNLAKAGDESRYMLGVEERKILASHLANGSPAGGKWDVLLFSGGGNDVVDNPMALWIKDFDATVPPGFEVPMPNGEESLLPDEEPLEDPEQTPDLEMHLPEGLPVETLEVTVEIGRASV